MRARLSLAVLIATSLAGCLIIPYQPGSETKHDLAPVPDPDLVALTVAPRAFLDEIASDVLRKDARLQRVDGQTFLDAASPDRTATLAGMLDPAARARLETTDVDYLIVLGMPDSTMLEQWGGVVPLVGLEQKRYSTTHWAAVIDMRRQRLIEQLSSTSVGTEAGVWLFYGIFVAGDTGAGAKKGIVRHVVQTIASDRPEGELRVAFVASRHLPSAEESDRLDEEDAIRRDGSMRAWALRDRPRFAAAPPPAIGQALVYVYDEHPASTRISGVPANLYIETADAKIDITQMHDGGYVTFYAPAGPLALSLEWAYKFSRFWRDAALTVDLREGETYYIRAEGPRGLLHVGLSAVDASEARTALEDRVLLPSAREVNAQLLRRASLPGNIDEQLQVGWLYARGARYADGQSVAPDDVEAYKWFRIVEAVEQMPKASTGGRKLVAARMDSAQIAEAERRAADWRQAHGVAP